MKRFKSISPHDNSILGDILISTSEEVAHKVALARAALPEWCALGVAGRAALLQGAVQKFTARKEEFAQLVSQEMGMPIQEARDDIDFALDYLRWYLDNAELYLKPEVVFTDGTHEHTVYHEPYGVVGVIVPWNFPASNFVWGCGQALIAGNTVVFKSSEEVPMCGKLIEEVMGDIGLPEGVFNEVYGRGSVGAILARQDVDLLMFTGSSVVGESLYRTAAQGMKKIVMELGGSAPGIVLEGADLSQAVGQIYNARFINAGQMCDALKRLIVHENSFDLVVEKMADRLRMIIVGDPRNTTTTMGPLVNKKQVDLLERQVGDALEKGALVVVGGKRPAYTGAYYEPTLLTQVTRDMRVWQEEVFGPVLPIVTFKTEKEAVALANDTVYGLGAYVWGKEEDAARMAHKLQSGMVSINGVSYVRPTNPFGGYKRSGLGREHGRFGFAEVTQPKVVARKKA